MNFRYLYTVFTGRAGGMQLTHFLNRNTCGCLAENEYPGYEPRFTGRLGSMELAFHRRFIETHELLGRGKVIRAFVSGDDAYVEKIARKRWERIEALVRKHNAHTFFDVSKCISRGMHTVLDRFIPHYSVLLIVRDPVGNMASFLNRDKNFLLDNNLPDDPCNALIMDSKGFQRGEFYLWMWCELILRFHRICQSSHVEKSAIIRSEDMNKTEKMRELLTTFEIPYHSLEIKPPSNTNAQAGFAPTRVEEEHVRLFERFMNRLPNEVVARIDYLKDYDPRRSISPSQ